MVVRVQCPNPDCGKRYRIDDSLLGQRFVCRKCRQAFVLSDRVDQTTGARGDTEASEARARNSQQASGSVPEQLGRFQIRSRLGAGAFGTVYRAFDPVLDREVALKVPREAALEKPEARARFLREPKAAAQLRHPNIVPIYDAGSDGDHCYIASAFIEGHTLAEVLEHEHLDFRRAAEIVRQLAGALDYAHRNGVIHRDVKPANVMIDGRDRPTLMDFGLARVATSEEKLTQDGSVLGTPAYMAPEQADGTLGEVGMASDQYSLGVVLYELLTGQTPFSGPPAVLIFNAIHQQPPTPRSIHAKIPRDLETICLKAMAKRAPERYADCGALGEDLRRWLKDEPIQARPLRPTERFVRWCRHNPAVAGLSLTASFLLLLVAVIASVGFYRTSRALELAEIEKNRADTARAEAEDAQRRSEEQRQRAEVNLYFSRIPLAVQAWQENDLDAAEAMLELCPEELRNWEWSYAKRLCHLETFSVVEDEKHFVALAVSPDGRRVVAVDAGRGAERPGIAYCWAPNGDSEAVTHTVAAEFVTTAKITADLGRIVVVDISQEITIFDLNEGKPLTPLESNEVLPQETLDAIIASKDPRPHLDKLITALAITRDAGRIAAAYGDGRLKVWDGETGALLHEYRGLDERILALAFSPDGAKLAFGGMTKRVKLMDVASGDTVADHSAEFHDVSALTFSPDGDLLAAGCWDHVRVWNTSSGELVAALMKGHVSRVQGLAFAPDSRRIASAGSDGAVNIWDVDEGSVLQSLRVHAKGLSRVLFGEDGHTVGAAGMGHCKLFDLRTAGESVVLAVDDGHAVSLAFSPDSSRLATANNDGTVRTWDARTGAGLSTLRGHDGLVRSVAFSPDGARIASGAWNGAVKIWNATTGVEEMTLQEDTHPVMDVVFSPDGRRLFAGGGERTDEPDNPGYIYSWDLETGKKIFGGPRHGHVVTQIAVSPDGKRIASASWDGTAKVWDAATGEMVHTVTEDQGHVYCVAFSPDGCRFLEAGSSRVATVWDTAKWEPLLQLRGHNATIQAAQFSVDGSRIITSGRGALKLWDAEAGRQILSLRGHEDVVMDVAMSPDGRRIASVSEEDTARIWDAGQFWPPAELKLATGPSQSDGEANPP